MTGRIEVGSAGRYTRPAGRYTPTLTRTLTRLLLHANSYTPTLTRLLSDLRVVYFLTSLTLPLRLASHFTEAAYTSSSKSRSHSLTYH
jgi:hypothetical protein